MRFGIGLFILAASVPLLGEESPESVAIKRIGDHLLIKDPSSAVREGKRCIERYPDSEKLHRAYFQALCQKGDEIEAFQEFSWLFPPGKSEKGIDRTAFEWLAWGVLSKGESSPLLMIRLYSLLGAGFTQDARALPVLLKELKGTNAMLRSLAVRLSASYGDAPLQDELVRLLKEEKVWFVRLEVIRAVGTLRIERGRDVLRQIIASSRTLAEEKAEAILALAGMYDALSQQELVSLVSSDRAGLRHLGSEIVAHLDFKEGVDCLAPLLFDASPDVRISVMNTLSLLRTETLRGKPVISLIQKNLIDPNPAISITAARLAVLLGNEVGKKTLDRWMDGDRPEPRRLAAAAIASLGPHGVKMALDRIRKESDPYVGVNLAIGLIGQRKNVEAAGAVLFQALLDGERDLWMWDSSANPLLRSLSPSEVRHIEQIPGYPQVVDRLVRLDILSMLSLIRHPQALDAVKDFLKSRSWRITGAAASTLLQEGDEGALEEVRKLLEDSDEKIKVQAGLILALVGRDPGAIKVLTDAYPHVDRELKIHILEALGHIGDVAAVPFLIELLKEPFQGLRVVAAAALIQCL